MAAVGLVAVAVLTKGTPVSEVVPSVAIEATASPARVGCLRPGFRGADRGAADPGPVADDCPAKPRPVGHPESTFAAVPAAPGTLRLGEEQQSPIRLSMVVPGGWAKATDGMYVKGRGEAPAGMSFGA